MTHEKLLANIDAKKEPFYNEITEDFELPDMELVNALRAVVELHKPWEGEYFDKAICMACTPDIYVYEYYPCKTIQAIEEHLK